MNTGYAFVSLFGEVTVPPEERYYGLDEQKKLVEFVVLVEKSTGTQTERWPFRVAVFSEQLMQQALALQGGDLVCVLAELTNSQYQAKDGRLYDRYALRARAVEPLGKKPVRRAPQQQQFAYGQQQQPPYRAPEPRPFGRAPQHPVPPPVSQEEDDDIPF